MWWMYVDVLFHTSTFGADIMKNSIIVLLIQNIKPSNIALHFGGTMVIISKTNLHKAIKFWLLFNLDNFAKKKTVITKYSEYEPLHQRLYFGAIQAILKIGIGFGSIGKVI